MKDGAISGDSSVPRDYFATTRWTVVLDAAQNDTTRARAALGRLYQTYWYPLYAYVRRRGYPAADAEDLTQGYFARLLELDSLRAVCREKGKFRSFLLAGLKNFLAREWERSRAQKRDVRVTESLDTESAESRYEREPADTETPERLFERKWAVTLMESVVLRLRREYEADGKSDLFVALRFAIMGERGDAPYAELAERLAMSEAAVRSAVYRLRQQYRKVLREEIAHTVADEADIDEELRHLRRIVSS